MKLFSSGSGLLLLALATGVYFKNNKPERAASPIWEQKLKPSASSTATNLRFSEDQKRVALLLITALAASQSETRKVGSPQAPGSSPHAEFYGYQTGRSQSQYPALRGESPSAPTGRTADASRGQLPSRYYSSTSMPGGSTDAQRFVNEFTRLYPGTASSDALGLYEAIKSIR